ncbi:MAG: hypothetical protein EON54_16635 [Alcaligenaceae bacterium]|nr:MAG: hypothetical protein EON54_16635 [Alcaligenaceae bacterium]
MTDIEIVHCQAKKYHTPDKDDIADYQVYRKHNMAFHHWWRHGRDDAFYKTSMFYVKAFFYMARTSNCLIRT